MIREIYWVEGGDKYLLSLLKRDGIYNALSEYCIILDSWEHCKHWSFFSIIWFCFWICNLMLHSFLFSKATDISVLVLYSNIYSIIRFYVSEECIFIVTLISGTCFWRKKVMDVTYAKIFAILILWGFCFLFVSLQWIFCGKDCNMIENK